MKIPRVFYEFASQLKKFYILVETVKERKSSVTSLFFFFFPKTCENFARAPEKRANVAYLLLRGFASSLVRGLHQAVRARGRTPKASAFMSVSSPGGRDAGSASSTVLFVAVKK